MHRPLVGIVAVALVGASSASAAFVHIDALPATVDASFSRASSQYLYLEGETVTQGASDTFVSAADASRTRYRTSANPSDFWGSGEVYDGARYAVRGANIDFTDMNSYWEDLATGLSAGTYDVFIRAYSHPGGTQTFSLYAGSDRASVDSGTAVGSATTPSDGVARWYALGTVALAADIDTFRLRIDTAATTVRFDTILFAAVPEPASVVLLGLGGIVALHRRAASA